MTQKNAARLSLFVSQGAPDGAFLLIAFRFLTGLRLGHAALVCGLALQELLELLVLAVVGDRQHSGQIQAQYA